MSARRQSSMALPAALLAACVGLVWTVYQEMAANSRPRPIAAPAGGSSVAALPAPLEFTMAALEDFEETIDRPLFSASRRPPAAAPGVAAGPVPVEQLELVLKGVIISTNGQIAILSDTVSNTTVTLGQGKTYRGWTLAEILPERVVFRRAGQKQQFALDYEVAPTLKPPTGKRQQPSQTARPPRQTDADPAKPTRGAGADRLDLREPTE